MKTAISIDDSLLREADQTARAMGLSRSRLFTLALGGFLREQSRERTLRLLNEVYGDGSEPDQAETVKRIKAKVRGTIRERW
jgi:antitoxin component of RelBE/YafQ-DinJ toxin-antitoxin module